MQQNSEFRLGVKISNSADFFAMIYENFSFYKERKKIKAISRIVLNFHSLYRDCVWYKKNEVTSVHYREFHYIVSRNNEVWVYLGCAVYIIQLFPIFFS